MSKNQKDWTTKLVDALRAYRTAFTTILGMSPYNLVFEKAYHLPVKLEHRALWITKQLNFDLNKTGNLWKLQIFELEDLRNKACENAKITKNKVKVFHDKFIIRKPLSPDKKSYSTTLDFIFFREVMRWPWPFIVRIVFPHGAVEICDPKNGNKFKVNGQT